MKNILIVSYGNEEAINDNITLINNINSRNFCMTIASILKFDNKNVKYSLFDYNNFKVNEKHKHLFYYFFQDRFINEMSELVGYVSINNTIEDIWANFYRTVNFVDYVLDKINPEFIYTGSPDNFFVNLFAKIAESRNIKYFWLEVSYFKNKSYSFFSSLSYTNDIVKNKIELQEKNIGNLEKFFTKNVVKSNPLMFKKNNIKSKIVDNIRYIKSLEEQKKYSKENLMLLPYVSVPFYNIKNKITRLLNGFKNRKFLNRCFNLEMLKEIKKEKKVLLLALHYQPEAATLSMQPLINDQYYLIKILSDILPPNYVLVVKEHPLQDTNLRSPYFYERITSKKNVFLIDLNISSNYLLENNLVDNVATIGGTIGFEEILRRRPPLVFSNIYYSNFKYTFNVELKNIDNLITRVNEFLNFDYKSVENDYEEELIKFLKNYDASIIKSMEKFEAIEYVINNNRKFWK